MNNGIKNRGGDRDEIRQIQMLMLMCLCLPTQGKLRELIEMALASSGERTMNRVTPPEDVSVDGLFDWLTALYNQQDLTEEEKSLMKWQNDRNNMLPAISEIKAIEEKLGFKLGIQKI
ncbi:DurN family substrate-assisted peptide maturase [Microseira sp. BLCC-F43]|jgi:hypothetical protein|uniref:DurN family substrate-assisted peptide maturase n=1 Tax=Microseira sp. BLCC-F43 TaxID=3153602 RepID=UPI0035B9225B